MQNTHAAAPPQTWRRIVSELILDPRHTAVVVIDLQKGIVGFPASPHSAQSVIANAVTLLDAARSTGAHPILVHVGRSPDGGDGLQVTSDQPMRAAGALPPDWSELIPELNRQPNDIVILKRQWGAFYGTDLELQLRRRNLNTIVLCGIATAIRRRKHGPRRLRARLRAGVRGGRNDGALRRKPRQLHRQHLSPHGPRPQHRRNRRRFACKQMYRVTGAHSFGTAALRRKMEARKFGVARKNNSANSAAFRGYTATDPGPSQSTPPSASHTRRQSEKPSPARTSPCALHRATALSIRC